MSPGTWIALLGGVGLVAFASLKKGKTMAANYGPPKVPGTGEIKPPKGAGPKPSTPVTSSYSGDLEGLSDSPVARSAEILSLIRQGRFEVPIVFLTTSKGPLRARLAVTGRALTVDGVRVSMTEQDQTLAADTLGAHLLTPFLVDEIWKRADVRLEPKTQAWYGGPGGDGSMGTKRRVFDYNEIVEKELGEVPPEKLVASEGKDWVIDGYAFTPAGRIKGTNYGWHRKNGKPVQGLGRVHNLAHTDYSQLFRFVSSVVSLSEDDGQTWRDATFTELVSSPKLFPLVSYERLPAARHPGVGGIAV